MATRVRIRINNNSALGSQLFANYEIKSQVQMAQWAIKLAKHIPEFINYGSSNQRTQLAT